MFAMLEKCHSRGWILVFPVLPNYPRVRYATSECDHLFFVLGMIVIN